MTKLCTSDENELIRVKYTSPSRKKDCVLGVMYDPFNPFLSRVGVRIICVNNMVQPTGVDSGLDHGKLGVLTPGKYYKGHSMF